MIFLPLPPSTNNLYVNAKFGRGRYVSKEYRAWQQEAALCIPPAVRGAYKPRDIVGVTIRAAVDHRRDIDNIVKPVLDLLVKKLVIPDDRYVNEIRISRVKPGDGVTGLVVEVRGL